MKINEVHSHECVKLLVPGVDDVLPKKKLRRGIASFSPVMHMHLTEAAQSQRAHYNYIRNPIEKI